MSLKILLGKFVAFFAGQIPVEGHKNISPEDAASTVAYALSRPADVTLENISISSLTGNL